MLRVLLLVAVVSACADGRARMGTSTLPGPGTAAVPVVVAEEIGRIGGPKGYVGAMALGPADTLLVGTGDVLRSVDMHLRERWQVRLPARIEEIVVLDDQRFAIAYGQDDALGLAVVERDGRIAAQAAFAELTGVACSRVAGSWLRAERALIVADVACRTSKPQSSTFHFDPALSRVVERAITNNSERPRVVVENAAGMITLLRGNSRTPLVAATPEKHQRSVAVQLPGSEDAIAAALLLERRGETSAQRLLLARAGATSWSRDLIEEQPTLDSVRFVGVHARADRIDVGVVYGHGTSSRGMRLPVLPAGARFPALLHRMSIIEVAAASGDVARITVLNTGADVEEARLDGLLTTDSHVFAIVDDVVVAFRRTPQQVSPEQVATIPAAAPRQDIEVAGAATSTISERWSETCGPRWTTKGRSPCRLEHVALGKDGTVVATGSFYDKNQLGARKLKALAYETALLTVYDATGALRWHRTAGGTWNNSFERALVRDDGRIVVTGYHAQRFAIEGVRLPDRDVSVADGQTMDHEATVGFLAVFDRTGKLELLADLDTLLLGEPQRSVDRICAADLAQGAAEDEAIVVVSCTFARDGIKRSTPRTVGRFTLRGAVAGKPEIIASGAGEALPSTPDPRGRVFGVATAGELAAFVALGAGAPRLVPISTTAAEPSRLGYSHVATTRSRVWLSTVLRDLSTRADQLAIASADLDLTRASLRVLARDVRDAHIDAMAFDEHGRPYLSISISAPLTLAGQTFTPSPTKFGVVVRLSSDGSKIEHVFRIARRAGACADAGAGARTSMAARGGVLAMTFRFGVEPRCGVHDEMSTVMTFALP